MLDRPSNYPHYESALGVYNGDPFAIAGNANLQVEEFGRNCGNITCEDLTWRVLDPIPAKSDRLLWFSTVTYDQIAYVFGNIYN